MAESHEPGAAGQQRERELSDTRIRLTKTVAEAHRLRARLARLEAAGEEEAARRLEAQIDALPLGELTDHGAAVADPPPAHLRRPDARHAWEPNESTGAASDDRSPSSRRPDSPGPHEPVATGAESIQADAGLTELRRTSGAKANRSEKKAKRPRPGLFARLRDAPAWATSIGVHAAALLLLSLLTFATLQNTPPQLEGSFPDGDDDLFDQIAEIDFDPNDLETVELEETDLLLDPAEPVFDEQALQLDALGTPELAPGLASTLPTSAALLLAGDSGGQPDGQSGERGERPGGGKARGAQFFGARSPGDRFAFVVDNSSSMKQGRMETTLLELQRAIGALSPKQQFYIVFFSDQAYPMFYPDSTDEWAPATRENKQRLANWLPTVEICSGGKMIDAMKKVAELEPSAVYLLSDGQFSQSVRSYMTQDNDWQFVLHTFGMTIRSPEHAGNLVAIARAHGGGFTPVGVNPVAARMAAQRPIRNNNRGPGPVWGTKVRPR